jgi:hypothetical protein
MLKSDNINQENIKSYPFRVKNTCEFIKNVNILENKKKFSIKIYSIFLLNRKYSNMPTQMGNSFRSRITMGRNMG